MIDKCQWGNLSRTHMRLFSTNVLFKFVYKNIGASTMNKINEFNRNN